jgi:hypothetical protein
MADCAQVLLECGTPTMNVNKEDPRDYIRGDKKFPLAKKPRSGRLKRNKDDHHGSGSDSSDRHKPIKEKEKEKTREKNSRGGSSTNKDKREVERTRSERTREKLSGRERAAPPHQSPSGGRHDSGAPDAREAAGDASVPASPGRARSDSLDGSEEGMNSGGNEPATEKTGGEGGAKEKSSAFLKISMIKKSSLMDRLNKKRSAKKSAQGDKSNSAPSGVGGVAALIRDNNNNGSSSKDSDDDDDWASTSSDRGLSSDDEDSYVSDTDSVDNNNSEAAGGKTSSSSSSSAKRRNRGNYTARDRSTANRSPSNHRRNGGGAAAPLAKSTRGSKDGSRTERDKKPGATAIPAPTSVSKKSTHSPPVSPNDQP